MYVNGNTLDNRRSNLELFSNTKRNDFEILDDKTIAIILKDRHGKIQGKAIIDKVNLNKIVTDEHTWVYYKKNNTPAVVANTPNGRIYLEKLILPCEENSIINHINRNPLDNRRSNLELVQLEIEE